MGVGEAERLHRPVPKRLAAALGHHLDRQAAVEVRRALELAELGLFGGQQRVDEGFVLVAAHRTVDIGRGVAARALLVVARLHPGDIHVDRIAVHDRGDGVEEGERAFAGQCPDRLGEGGRCQRAGRDDDIVPVFRRQADNLAALERDELMRNDGRLDRLRETVSVDGERAAGRHLMGVGAPHDERAQGPHLPMQDADSVGCGIVRAERVRADELGEPAGTVGGGSPQGPHLMQNNGNAGLGRLPGGLTAGKAAADDVDRMHERLVTKGGGKVKRGKRIRQRDFPTARGRRSGASSSRRSAFAFQRTDGVLYQPAPVLPGDSG